MLYSMVETNLLMINGGVYYTHLCSTKGLNVKVIIIILAFPQVSVWFEKSDKRFDGIYGWLSFWS